MSPSDFKSEIDLLCALYAKKLPNEQFDAWWKAFSPFSRAEFHRAVTLACEDSRAFPAWGQISRNLRPIDLSEGGCPDGARKGLNRDRGARAEWEEEYARGCLEFSKSRPTIEQTKSFAGAMIAAYPEMSASARAQYLVIQGWKGGDARELRDVVQLVRAGQ